MDRISPKDFDPMGTTRRRFGDIPSDAITEQLNGKNVEWMEKVTDEQYLAGPQINTKEQ